MPFELVVAIPLDSLHPLALIVPTLVGTLHFATPTSGSERHFTPHQTSTKKMTSPYTLSVGVDFGVS